MTLYSNTNKFGSFDSLPKLSELIDYSPHSDISPARVAIGIIKCDPVCAPVALDVVDGHRATITLNEMECQSLVSIPQTD